MNLRERWQNELDQLTQQGRYRTLTPAAGIDFSSNDYLGYSKRICPQPATLERDRSGTASRLLRGHHAAWDEIEARLTAWHGAEAALIMTSGYVANEGLLHTVIEPGDVAFSDQRNHASIIDGLRLSRAEKVIFAHNDADDLETRMRQRRAARPAGQAWFVVTESLFGMEGDTAPLAELARSAEAYDAHLIVDEAHATGCFGPSGSGLVDELGLRHRVLATVHTGGKALAVPAAYIVGSRQLKELLVNRCRHLIYTTALAPALSAWWRDSLDLVQTDVASRNALREKAMFLRGQSARRGIALDGDHYIAGLSLGFDAVAVDAARRLQEAGFDVRAIRPPTVPDGAARLRISIHADHDTRDLASLADALTRILPSSS